MCKIPVMERRKTITIFPWSVSATGLWGPNTGIYNLRDETSEQIADWFGEVKDLVVIDSGLVEIMAHGNPRKSAEIARLLIEEHPEMEKRLKAEWGEEMCDFLLEGDLKDIPGKPSEYSGNVYIEYIQ